MPSLQRILIVDDDEAIRTSMAESLAKSHRDVRAVEDAAAALSTLNAWRADIVISDVRMPGLDGLELLTVLAERLPDADVIMMTAFDDMPTVVAAMRRGAVDFLVKPVDLHELRRTVDRLFSDRVLRRNASSSSTSDIETLIGRDPRMIETFKRIGQAATAQATVLVRGESGTGKELVARAIHANSSRSVHPFVPVNCAALPSSLLESELFGHVRGSFTGAANDRRGRFAVAGRGTIFLDEIGDTSSELQAKLLRTLQSGEYQPVGSEKTLAAEARVVAATHRPLELMIADGRFREDLYYRLRVIEIVLPSVRERPADIPVLAEHLTTRACRSLGIDVVAISPEAMEMLERHHWPGNVREMENCLTRAVVAARSGAIRPEHLSLSSPGERPSVTHTNLEAAEREHIARVFAAADRQKMKTAELLGVSRPRLDRLLRKHGLG